ncbi:hypothetical protein MMC20_007974 [Loxospora ochrophaea]|nr:hypothetical protein [Loxospora ochrophaea]
MTTSKPVLHVELCTKTLEGSPGLLADEISKWLRDNYVTLRLNQEIHPLDENVDSIQVTGITGTTCDPSGIRLQLVDIDVGVFQLYDAHGESLGPSTEDVLGEQAIVTKLPSREFHRLWDLLIFENDIKSKLLQVITRMITISSRQPDTHTTLWNRLVLLHGPPGTGKTSLCRALAQKLSIRLGKQYPSSRLVEINSHCLFSKYFSESGKLVAKTFEFIESILDTDEDMFVCVIIDEIESLTSAREQTLGSGDPRDALRAVNSLLAALDRLRSRPNIVVLCTSNLVEAMDVAFLDRVDIKQLVPQPCAEARYEIYRMCYLDLAKARIIAPISSLDGTVSKPTPLHNRNTPPETAVASITSPSDGASLLPSPREQGTPQETSAVRLENHWSIIDSHILPSYDLMQLHFWLELASPARKLWDIAERSKGLSGRALRRLPILSLAMHTMKDPCPIEEALDALSQAVEDFLSLPI